MSKCTCCNCVVYGPESKFDSKKYFDIADHKLELEALFEAMVKQNQANIVIDTQLQELAKETINQTINFEILKIIEEFLQKNPDQCFGQALSNLGLVEGMGGIYNDWRNEYYTESFELLERIKKCQK